MEEPDRLEPASFLDEGVQLLNTQELARSQRRDLRRQLQLLEDLTHLPAAPHPPSRLPPQATMVARIPWELAQVMTLAQVMDHQMTLEALVGQMQPMGHLKAPVDIPGGMLGEQTL